MMHDLKIVPRYYEPVKSGLKKFELRKNDRDYEVGDTLKLREWYPTPLLPSKKQQGYTGRELLTTVTYILCDSQYGLREDYCILGLGDVSEIDKQGEDRQNELHSQD